MERLPAFIPIVLTVVFCSCRPTTQANEQQDATGAETRLVSSPSRDTAPSRERALVRFVNADPHRPVLDFWLQDEKVFSAVPFRDVTPYQELPASRQMFFVNSSGQIKDLRSLSRDLTNGRRYTFFALMKPDGTTALRATEDDLAAPATQRPKLRLIHAAPGAGELTLVPTIRTSQPIFEHVQFGTATLFQEIGPSFTTFRLFRDGETANQQEQPALDLSDLHLRPDCFYTLVITTAGDSLEIFRFHDQLSGPGPEISAR